MRRIIKCNNFFVLVLVTCCLTSVFSQNFKKINIEISAENKAILENDPFSNDDVLGDFIVNDTKTFTDIDLHYRGAFYLLELIRNGSKRNWKVKFPKANKFENRREWNFNYENYISQNLAYKLFQSADVPTASPENVILYVNNIKSGLYLKYEDPDDKTWLTDTFGDNDGDLYKAATDKPFEQSYFADLSYLGDKDSDYFNHYRKQTNKKGDAEFDYSSIREFTDLINNTTDEEFKRQIEERFDVAQFIRYLIVANFTSNWDSYPFRPKNFLLYDNPLDGKWHFIPWDLDGTFEEKNVTSSSRSGKNAIGSAGSIFHYFDGRIFYNANRGEPLDRPLVWRLMKIDKFRDKYIYEYQKAIDTYLSKSAINGIIDEIASGVANNTSGLELEQYNDNVNSVKSFISNRVPNVTEQLEANIILIDPFLSMEDYSNDSNNIIVFPNPTKGHISLILKDSTSEKIEIQFLNMLGSTVKKVNDATIENQLIMIDISSLTTGQYIMLIKSKEATYTKRITVQ